MIRRRTEAIRFGEVWDTFASRGREVDITRLIPTDKRRRSVARVVFAVMPAGDEVDPRIEQHTTYDNGVTEKVVLTLSDEKVWGRKWPDADPRHSDPVSGPVRLNAFRELALTVGFLKPEQEPAALPSSEVA